MGENIETRQCEGIRSTQILAFNVARITQNPWAIRLKPYTSNTKAFLDVLF